MPDETKTVVTKRADMVTDKQAENVIVVLVSPVKIVVVRALRVYVQTLAGLLTAATTGVTAAVGVTMPAGDFFKLFVACASIALAPAVMSILLNTGELLAKWDATHPMLRA
jgi:hypothetical protein